MTAFDSLFWLLIAMLAVVAYAIEAGLATRNRMAVLSTLFSVIGSIVYIMVIGDENSLGHAWSTPSLDIGAKMSRNYGDKSLISVNELKKIDITDQRSADPPPKPVEVPRTPFIDCDHCPSMIGIPPGAFTMGSPPNEPGHQDTEFAMSVDVKRPFAVGRFEITRDQFAAFVEDAKYQLARGCLVEGKTDSTASWMSPGFEQAGNHPVVCISYRDARAYVAWLSAKTGKSYRLLSEAEWEYVARAGTKTVYPSGTALQAGSANFNRSRDGTIPIGFTLANGFQVHDMLGNAWEMVEDCWNPDLSFNNADGTPTLLRGNCSLRVIKGGGWESNAAQSRPASRSTVTPTTAANTVGFRVARVLD